MRNAGLDEAQVGTKTEVSVTCYADDTTIMEEGKELKSLLKEESEKAGLKLNSEN